jgi:hypothetical protein
VVEEERQRKTQCIREMFGLNPGGHTVLTEVFRGFPLVLSAKFRDISIKPQPPHFKLFSLTQFISDPTI